MGEGECGGVLEDEINSLILLISVKGKPIEVAKSSLESWIPQTL